MTCSAGARGSGGICDCSEAKGWNENEWGKPWCVEGACYTGQEYDECKNKDYSRADNYDLGDGTWCHKGKMTEGERNTRCPTTSGNVIVASGHFVAH